MHVLPGAADQGLVVALPIQLYETFLQIYLAHDAGNIGHQHFTCVPVNDHHIIGAGLEQMVHYAQVGTIHVHHREPLQLAPVVFACFRCRNLRRRNVYLPTDKTIGRIPIIYTLDVSNDPGALPVPGQQFALLSITSKEPVSVTQDVVPLPSMRPDLDPALYPPDADNLTKLDEFQVVTILGYESPGLAGLQ